MLPLNNMLDILKKRRHAGARNRPQRNALTVEVLEQRTLFSCDGLFDPLAFHSLPGAPHALVLDFDGYRGPAFNGTIITQQPFNHQGSSPQTLEDEKTDICRIFERVADDYSPFNIDVTTAEPAHTGPNVKRIIFSDFLNFSGNPRNAAGVARPRGAVGHVYTDRETICGWACWANTASHEAGHLFGLHHQTVVDVHGNVTDVNRGDRHTAAIMGYPDFSGARSIWSSGPSVTDQDGGPPLFHQDDIAILSQELGYRPDENVGTVNLTFDATERQLKGSGVIARTSDTDWFPFDVVGDQPTLVMATVTYENLRPTFQIRSRDGDIVASIRALGSRQTLIREELEPGEYYFVVGSEGAYGDVGKYDIELREATGLSVTNTRHLDGRTLRLTFDDWVDPSSFTPTDPRQFPVKFYRNSSQIDLPVGAAVSVEMWPGDTDQRVWDIHFPDLDVEGFEIRIGPNIQDRYGNSMNQVGDTADGAFEYPDFAAPIVNRATPRYGNILVEFDEPIDDATFDADQVELTDFFGNPVPYSTVGVPRVVAGTNGQHWEIPVNGSYPNGRMRLTLLNGIRDEFGNRLAPYSTHWTDGDGPRVESAYQTVDSLITSEGVTSRTTQSGRVYFVVSFNESVNVPSFDPNDVYIGDPVPNPGLRRHPSLCPECYRNAAEVTQFSQDATGDSRTFLIGVDIHDYGEHELYVGGTIEDLFGNVMDQNANGSMREMGDYFVMSFDVARRDNADPFVEADVLDRFDEPIVNPFIDPPIDPGPDPYGRDDPIDVARYRVSWGEVAGADYYDLYIDDLTTGKKEAIRTDVKGANSFGSEKLLPGHQYRFWVQAYNSLGNPLNSWTKAHDFTVPNALSVEAKPQHDAGADDAGHRIKWDEVAGADYYDLYIDDLTTGKKEAIRTDVKGANSFGSEKLLPGHQYRFWVQAYNSLGNPLNSWTKAHDFTVPDLLLDEASLQDARPMGELSEPIDWELVPIVLESL